MKVEAFFVALLRYRRARGLTHRDHRHPTLEHDGVAPDHDQWHAVAGEDLQQLEVSDHAPSVSQDLHSRSRRP